MVISEDDLAVAAAAIGVMPQAVLSHRLRQLEEERKRRSLPQREQLSLLRPGRAAQAGPDLITAARDISQPSAAPPCLVPGPPLAGAQGTPPAMGGAESQRRHGDRWALAAESAGELDHRLRAADAGMAGA
jgi:hypothetical protein